MTLQLIRTFGADGSPTSAYQIARNIGADGSWGGNAALVNCPIGTKLIRLPSGPPGANALTAASFGFQGGYNPNEVIDGQDVTLTIAAVDAGCAFVTTTKPTAVFTVGVLLNTVQIGTATIDPATCGPGPVFVGAVALNGGAQAILGLLGMQLPSSVDATLTRATLTVGSTAA